MPDGHFLVEWYADGRHFSQLHDVLGNRVGPRQELGDGFVDGGAIAVSSSGLLAHAEKVSTFIKNTIGISTRIKVVAPETLERSLGKAKRVFDKRPKE